MASKKELQARIDVLEEALRRRELLTVDLLDRIERLDTTEPARSEITKSAAPPLEKR